MEVYQSDMTFDNFDDRLLRIAERDSRALQASHGNARLSLYNSHSRPSPIRIDQGNSRSSSPVSTWDTHPALEHRQRSATHYDQTIPQHPYHSTVPSSRQPELPSIRGITLVPTCNLRDDRLSAVFPYPFFNAIQSKSFPSVFGTDNNFVLSSPTGSGKTVIFELAICRVVKEQRPGSYKIIYMAPIKALCSERAKDWDTKFKPAGLVVKEVTGDSDAFTLRAVQAADLIVTTPEKWDSMTRKWRDHRKLVELIRLMLIDEVHILGKDRGATLEAVVSRMKSINTHTRFVAVSATIPNASDIATWLGKDPTNASLPALREEFGEEFRPVPLQVQVIGYDCPGNDFQFDAVLTKKLPDVVSRASSGKPIMVFCPTKTSCHKSAMVLAEMNGRMATGSRLWAVPSQHVVLKDGQINALIKSGVAFHHAGLCPQDKSKVEDLYLRGQIGVICCTSTLAVGVNLPCHTVIIKGTSTFENGVLTELSDLEILQMLGRAGRPQFDREAAAIIMTKSHRREFYSRMTTSQQILESRLHRNLTEHINAEIGLGSITDMSSAARWLSGTFLAVRLQQNPDHYHLSDSCGIHTTEETVSRICSEAVELLMNHDLAEESTTSSGRLTQSPLGAAMARYCISFETMKGLVARSPRPKVSDILTMICNAHEFRDLKLRAKEKQAFKDANSSPCTRFPFKNDLAQSSQKVSLILQSVLGSNDTLSQSNTYRQQYGMDQFLVLQQARRIVRCIVDCQVAFGDSEGILNSLMLVRSLEARVWDDLPLVIQQLSGVGPVVARKLINSGIRSIQDVVDSHWADLERITSRNPPFGTTLVQKAKSFPQLRMSLRVEAGPTIISGQHVALRVSAEIGFINQHVSFKDMQHDHICFLAAMSDGQNIDFCRISAVKISPVLKKTFEVKLTRSDQKVKCFVSCEERAGTQCEAMIEPDIQASAFHSIQAVTHPPISSTRASTAQVGALKTVTQHRQASSTTDDFIDDTLDDNELYLIDPVAAKEQNRKRGATQIELTDKPKTHEDSPPRRLPNGNWMCRHKCKDKTKCTHDCCKQGTESKPKPRTAKSKVKKVKAGAESPFSSLSGQRMPLGPISKNAPVMSSAKGLETVDLTQRPTPVRGAGSMSNYMQKLNGLHHATTNMPLPSTSETSTIRGRSTSKDLSHDEFGDFEGFEDIDADIGVEEPASRSRVPSPPGPSTSSIAVSPSQPMKTSLAQLRPLEMTMFDEDSLSDQEMLDAALVGAEDSYTLSKARHGFSVRPGYDPREDELDEVVEIGKPLRDPAPTMVPEDTDQNVFMAESADIWPDSEGMPDFLGSAQSQEPEMNMDHSIVDEEAERIKKEAERKDLEAFVYDLFGGCVELA